MTHTHTLCLGSLARVIVGSIPALRSDLHACVALPSALEPKGHSEAPKQAMIRWRGRQSTWGSREPIEGYQLYQRYPLVNIQKAMENGPFIDGLPVKIGDFP